MKKYLKRAVAAALSAVTVLAAMPVGAADALASYSNISALANGLTLTEKLSKTSVGEIEKALTLDYTPGGGVKPIVVYGNKVYGKSDIDSAVSYAESQGNTVMAAINADFFQMSTGVPIGMVINNGRLCVSNGNWTSIGIKADGSMIHGTPMVYISATAVTSGLRVPIYAINKNRSEKGIFLYSSDYAADTRTNTLGTHVVLQAVAGDYLKTTGAIKTTVVSVTTGTAPAVIAANQFVLSIDATCKTGASLAGFSQGLEVTLNTSASDPAWNSVLYSCGGGEYMLREGQLTTASNGTSAVSGAPLPRTMLGFRPNGSVVFFEFDGGANATTKGITLKAAAQRLQELGCTNVINLDGGGSSAISIRKAGLPKSTIASSPSDGAQRKCANYIMLVNSGDKTAAPSKTTVYAASNLMLPGASTTLTGYSFNDSYYPGSSFASGFAASSGSVSGNVFTAPSSAGEVSLTLPSANLTAEKTLVTVTSAPQTIAFKKAGSKTALTALSIEPNEKIDLDMLCTDGLREIASNDKLFTYKLDGTAGVIDANGVFTAGAFQGLSGVITATYGTMSTSIRVTVGTPPVTLTDFENGVEYVTTVLDTAKTKAAAGKNTAPEYARYGLNSLKLSYSTKATAEKITYYSKTRYLTRDGSHISLLCKGSGEYSVDFATKTGETISVPFTLAAAADWQYIPLAIPANSEYVLGFSAKPVATANGSLFVDMMVRHNGTPTADLTPPKIEAQPYDICATTYKISDNSPYAIEKSMIEVKANGVAYPFSYENGHITIQTPGALGVHKLTTTVRDTFGNASRVTTSVGKMHRALFSDLTGNWTWAQNAAEFLRERGVFAESARFNPGSATTNEMAAALISRYLHLDTAKYAAVKLPYSDVAKISSWALPHVKALYAAGVMQGGTSNGVSVFRPQGNITREQVMTIFGRTLSRDLTCAAPAFPDIAKVSVWAKSHVELLSGLGIVKGESKTGNVNPQKTITRAEFASIIYGLY